MIGKLGTPERDEYESKLKSSLRRGKKGLFKTALFYVYQGRFYFGNKRDVTI